MTRPARAPTSWPAIAGQAALFGVAAASGRFVFQHVESRLQIAAFALLAVALEVGRAEPDAVRRLARPVACAAAAAVGVVAVKAWLEPVNIHADLHQARATVRRAVAPLR